MKTTVTCPACDHPLAIDRRDDPSDNVARARTSCPHCHNEWTVVVTVRRTRPHERQRP